MESTEPSWENPEFRRAVDATLTGFLDDHAELLSTISTDTDAVSESLSEFLTGGKRMRGVLCYWGWRAAGGELDADIATAAAAMEFLQAAALIHDDLMDGSDTRRGRPAIHRRFETTHRQKSYSGSAERFGQSAAILLGDLCLSWADELLYSPQWEPAQLARGMDVYNLMRTELMVGQYLDVLEQAKATDDVESALRVATYKSGRYTVERPLQLGAALATEDSQLIEDLGEYGGALGQAFQLRDDLLGVFGESQQTGKPAGDDLREGKRTVLIALTKKACSPTAARTLESGLGNPDLSPATIDTMRRIITESGAVERAENMIDDLLATSLASLERGVMPDSVRETLISLARSMTHRTT